MKPALVLAYHGLGSYPRPLDPHNLMVPAERFHRQLHALRRRGYRFVRLAELALRLSEGRAPQAGTCALTFDDGTVDNVEVLAPLLRSYAVPATVFVCPGLLGQAHFSMPRAAGVRLMDAEQLRRLASVESVEIGSHTNEHVDLADASADDAYREMASSKGALEELLQKPVSSFAYPKCGYSAACPEAARRAGYAVAVTCGGRGGWRSFELARESIDPLDGAVGFALKSRRLFFPLRESAPGRVARAVVRPLRHSGAGRAEAEDANRRSA